MRADFYGDLASYPVFSQLVSSHQILVEPLSQLELQEAIERPASRVGARLESGLLEERRQFVNDLLVARLSPLHAWVVHLHTRRAHR